jgi:hypothetical protein
VLAVRVLLEFCRAFDSDSEARLVRCIDVIFGHVVSALANPTVHDEVIEDYATTLLNYVLPRPAYMHVLVKECREDVLKLLRCVTRKLGACSALSPFEHEKHARLLEALTTRYPVDLEPLFDELVDFWPAHFAVCRHEKPLGLVLTSLVSIVQECAVNRCSQVVQIVQRSLESLLQFLSAFPRSQMVMQQVLTVLRFVFALQVKPSGGFYKSLSKEQLEQIWEGLSACVSGKSLRQSSVLGKIDDPQASALSRGLAACCSDVLARLSLFESDKVENTADAPAAEPETSMHSLTQPTEAEEDDLSYGNRRRQRNERAGVQMEEATAGAPKRQKRAVGAASSHVWHYLNPSASVGGEASDADPLEDWMRLHILEDALQRYAEWMPHDVLRSFWTDTVRIVVPAATSSQIGLAPLHVLAACARALSLAHCEVPSTVNVHAYLIESLPSAPCARQEAILDALAALFANRCCGTDVSTVWSFLSPPRSGHGDAQQQFRPLFEHARAFLGFVGSCLAVAPPSDLTERFRVAHVPAECSAAAPEEAIAVMSLLIDESDTRGSLVVDVDLLHPNKDPALAAVRALEERFSMTHDTRARDRVSFEWFSRASVRSLPVHARAKVEEVVVSSVAHKCDSLISQAEDVSAKRRRTLGVDVASMSDKLVSCCHFLQFLVRLRGLLMKCNVVDDVCQRISEFVAAHLKDLDARPKKLAEVVQKLASCIAAHPQTNMFTAAADSVASHCVEVVDKELLSKKLGGAAAPESTVAVADVDDFEFGSANTAGRKSDAEDLVVACVRACCLVRRNCSFVHKLDDKLRIVWDRAGSLRLPLHCTVIKAILEGITSESLGPSYFSAIFTVFCSKESVDAYMLRATFRGGVAEFLDILMTAIKLMSEWALLSSSPFALRGIASSGLKDVAKAVRCILTDWWKPRLIPPDVRCKLVDLVLALILLPSQLEITSDDYMVNSLLIMLKDTDYRARLQASLRVSQLFHVYDEHAPLYQTIFQVLAPMLSRQVAFESRLTPIVALARICAVSFASEVAAVSAICMSCTEDAADFASTALSDIAVELEYRSLSAYMSELLPSVLGIWFSQRKPLSEFPFQLLGARDLAAFVVRHRCPLVIHCVLSGALDELRQVAKMCGVTVPELVVEFAPSVFAHVHPLAYGSASHVVQFKSISATLPKIGLTEEVLNAQITRRVDDFIIALFDVVDVGGGESNDSNAAAFSQSAVTKVFFYLGAGFKAATVADVLYRTRDRVHKIVLHLHEQLTASHRTQRKLIVINKLALLMEILREGDNKSHRAVAVAASGQPVSSPHRVTASVFRDLLHFLLRGLVIPSLQHTSCKLLRLLCDTALVQNPDVLQRHLSRIVAALLPVAMNGGDVDASACAEAASLLDLLVVQNFSVMGKESICALDPFPDGAASMGGSLNEVVVMYNRARGRPSLYDDLLKFCLRDFLASSAEGTRLAVAHLLDRLQSGRQELQELIASKNSIAPMFAWTLIRAFPSVVGTAGAVGTGSGSAFERVTEESRKDGRLLAAACLGEIGFVDLLREDRRAGTSEHSCSLMDPQPRVIISLLLHAYELLVDEDVATMRCASLCMRDLLSLNEGSQAFVALSKEDRGSHVCEDLYPFRPSKQEAAAAAPNPTAFPDASHLWSTKRKSYSAWIRAVSCAVCRSVESWPWLRVLAPLCDLKASFAEYIFPFAIRATVCDKKFRAWPALIQCMEEQVLLDETSPQEARRLVLRCLVIALPIGLSQKQVSVENFWRAARASLGCSLFASALYFLEHACEAEFGTLSLAAEDAVMGSDLAVRRQQYVEALRSVYSQLDEQDSMSGLPSGQDISASIMLFEHDGRWDHALKAYDRALGGSRGEGTVSLKRGLLRALGRLGQHHLRGLYLQGLAATNTEEYLQLSEVQLELAWRTSQWDVTDSRISALLAARNGLSFHQAALQCFRALYSGDSDTMRATLDGIRADLMSQLSSITLENTKAAGSVLCRLRFFQELEACWNVKYGGAGDVPVLRITDAWRPLSELMPFEECEMILSARVVALSSLNRDASNALLPSHLLAVSKAARKAGRSNVALDALYRLKLSFPGYAEGILEESKVLWASGEVNEALQMVRALDERLTNVGQQQQQQQQSNDDLQLLQAKVAFACGRWIIDTGAESARYVRQNYLKRAIELFQKQNDASHLCKVCYVMAKHADGVFQAYAAKEKSPEWLASVEVRKHRKAELDAVRKLPPDVQQKNGEVLRHLKRLQKQVDADAAEQAKFDSDRKHFLEDAARYYVNTLMIGSAFDLVIFPLCNLWFAEPAVNTYLAKQNKIERIPSHKWLPLAYQIASRLTARPGEFGETLRALLLKLTKEQPHQMMLKILALRNGAVLPEGHRGRGAHVVDEDKIQAAKLLLDELKRDSAASAAMVGKYELLCKAYLELAYFRLRSAPQQGKPASPEPVPGEELQIPEKFFILRLPADLGLPVTTLVGSSTDENDVPKLVRFDPVYKTPGGVNRPKKLKCYASDGRVYHQLLKGGDDMRQDAVMQGVFAFANRLLQQEPATRARQLHVRSYAVIPLSPAAGIVEWVEGSTALETYLTGGREGLATGAHARFRPQDISHMDAYTIMSKAIDAQKAKQFTTICSRFRPVLHRFFLEHFREPQTWFEKRLCYTRSVAASSMIGYIVGLGDRHLQNILIDEKTAEVVHIDLGIAFDQGKALPIPETIPFRLTRDIVDGMGITGAEGVFRRCCEEMMHVLRRNHHSLLQILEVLIHDPLYVWSLSPLQALQRQQKDVIDVDSLLKNNNSNNKADDEGGGAKSANNRDAESALLRVRQKLLGVENGEHLNVAAQVNMLINQARDPQLLSKLYVGLAAWC